jgi:hypothetical protein
MTSQRNQHVRFARGGEGTRLARRLAAEIDGEVLFDAASRGRYSTDASIYQVTPVGVVVPRNADAAIAAMQIALEEGVAILRECSIWLTDPRIFGDAYEPAPRSSTAASELVLSLSASWNSLPMWRDYAAAHTGLVIGFDFLQGILTADPAYDYRIAPVVYASDRSGGDTLLAKSQEWEHEDEWRLVAARRTPDDSGHRLCPAALRAPNRRDHRYQHLF